MLEEPEPVPEWRCLQPPPLQDCSTTNPSWCTSMAPAPSSEFLQHFKLVAALNRERALPGCELMGLCPQDTGDGGCSGRQQPHAACGNVKALISTRMHYTAPSCACGGRARRRCWRSLEMSRRGWSRWLTPAWREILQMTC